MLTRWQPFSELTNEFNKVQSELNQWLHRGAHRGGWPGTFPAINMWQDDNCLTLEAELPGFELEDIEILVDGESKLTIKGTRKFIESENGTWHRRERAYGEFRRTIELPRQVDPDKVEAVLKNGVLTIVLPKKEAIKPRKIDVKNS